MDGGGWTDAIAFGASFTQGADYTGPIVALNNRQGFGGTNNAKEAMTLDFGTLLAGHSARLRFHSASDSLAAGDGWYIDDVKLNGIAPLVFTFIVPEDGVCPLPLIVNAGADFTAQEHPEGSAEFSTVALNGAASDPNTPSGTLTYEWTQLSGPPVTRAGADTLTPNFTAPDVSADTPLSLRLTARSSNGLSQSDEVVVTIVNVDLPPAANAGTDQVADEGAGNNRFGGAFPPLTLLALGLWTLLRRRRARRDVSSCPASAD